MLWAQCLRRGFSLPVDAAPRRRCIEVGEALIRLGAGSILFAIAAVVLGFVLKSPAIHAGSADIGSRVELSRITDFGTVHPDIFWPRTPIKSQARVDQVRVASLEPEIRSDAATSDQDSLKAIPASAWWNESFDEHFPGLATRELPSDVDFFSPPDDDSRTAIYDITAHAVYLPNGRRLEAHSGLGTLIDNPRHVHVKMRGATPPNVYNLSLRERLFHGVRAIRLTPVDESKMYGRDGMLAHSYLHGPNGQSNGCVAFSNYPEFLNAFLKGEVTRLVVVERLENPPVPKVALGSPPEAARSIPNQSDRVGQYAAAE
jgi:hypothetical protein